MLSPPWSPQRRGEDITVSVTALLGAEGPLKALQGPLQAIPGWTEVRPPPPVAVHAAASPAARFPTCARRPILSQRL